MTLNQIFSAVALLALVGTINAQCDPESVDFGEATWGLNPDGETTFFDTAYVGLAYSDEVHLLVPSYAADVVPDTPLNAPIDSVVIQAVVLLDTLAGDTLTFEDVGLEYVCNNSGDCVDPCTFLGGGQYCATFSGLPSVEGDFVLSMEVNVWATVFGFPLATPYSFDGLPFPIIDPTSSVGEHDFAGLTMFPNPANDFFILDGAEGAMVQLMSAEGRLVKEWLEESSMATVSCDGWCEGVYFLRILKGEAVQVRRLLVQR